MERKYTTRPKWKRVPQKRYYQTYLETAEFKGYAALLCLDSVRLPLWVRAQGKPVCIVDTGYSWLQYFPINEHYALSTVFGADNQPIYWYIDICLQTGIGDDNIPWMDDLYLDIAVIPTGEVELLDADELEEDLQTGDIGSSEYDLVFRVATELMARISQKSFALMTKGVTDREMLLTTEPIVFKDA